MTTGWRRAIGALAATLAVGSAGVVGATGAHADGGSPFSVTVGTAVTGSVVDVTVDVTSDGSHAATSATVTLTDAQDPVRWVRGAITRVVALPAGCVDTCSADVAIDTAPWVDPGPDPDAANPTLNEEVAQVATVTVAGDPADGVPSAVGQSDWFTVDNHRHRIWYNGPGGGNYNGPDSVDGSWLVWLADSPMTETTAAPLDHVTVSFPGHDDLLPPFDVDPPADPNDAWTATVDTSKLPYGVWTARLVGFDTSGLATNVVTVPLVVDHGPRFTARLIAPTDPVAGVPTDARVEVTATAPVDPATVLDTVSVYVDDGAVPVAQECWCAGPLTRDLPIGNMRLAGGAHTVHVVVTDTQRTDLYGGTRERSTTHDIAMTVSGGPTIAWRPAGQFVVDGGDGTITATFTAWPGTTLRRWSVEVDGTVVGSGSLCPTAGGCLTSATRTAPVRLPDIGRQIVVVFATDSTGTTNVAAGHVTFDPGTVSTLTGPTRARYHTDLTLTGRVTSWLGVAEPNVPVQLQRRWFGTAAWRTVATGTTGRYGRVVFTRYARANAGWRLVTPAKPGAWGGSTSSRVRVTVTPRLVAQAAATSVRAGRSVRIDATTAPAVTGLRLTFQRRAPGSDVWRTVTTAPTDTTGHAHAAVRLPSSGRWSIRVVRAPATSEGGAVSGTLHVTAE